jgi:hypothetical protein
VSGDVVAIGGNIVVEGTANGDLVAIGGDIRLLGQSIVEGDAIAIGGTVGASPGAKATGETDSIPYVHLPDQRSVHVVGGFVFLACNLTIILMTALILRRRRTFNISESLKSRPWQVSIAGLMLLLVWGLLIILVANARGWAALLLGLAVLLPAVPLLAGVVGASAAVGSMLFPTRGWVFGVSAGALFVTVIEIIPLAGFILMMIILILCEGCGLISGFGSDPAWLGACFPRRISAVEWKEILCQRIILFSTHPTMAEGQSRASGEAPFSRPCWRD